MESYIKLEEAKRRLSIRLGIGRNALHVLGYVRELRRHGHYLGRQVTLDGGLKLSCYRVPVSAVDAVASLAERGGPMPV